METHGDICSLNTTFFKIIKHMCETQIPELVVVTQKDQGSRASSQCQLYCWSIVCGSALKFLILKPVCCHLVHSRVRSRARTHLSRLKNTSQ